MSKEQFPFEMITICATNSSHFKWKLFVRRLFIDVRIKMFSMNKFIAGS